MLKRGLLILGGIATFGLCLAAWQLNLGAKLHAVNDKQAKETSGFGAAGLAVDSVDAGGLIDYLGIRVKDVLIDVNGVRTLADGDADRAFRAKDQANAVQFSRDGRKWMTVVHAPTQTRVAFIVPSEVVEDPDNPYAKLALSAGLSADFTPSLPRDLSKYAAIVLLSEKTAEPAIVPALREFLRKGGGLVTVGHIPLRLCGQSYTGYADEHLNAIADWFGAASANTGGFAEKPLVLRTNKPYGVAMRSGESVYTPAGNFEVTFFHERDLSPDVVPVAQFDEQGDKFVSMFLRRYGDGRVVYTFSAFDPAWPKVQELFIASLRWAAKLEN